MAGADSFVFFRTEANGDLITDFTVGTDHLDFHGYNAGATFSLVGGAWKVIDGGLQETISFSGGAPVLTAGDYTFH